MKSWGHTLSFILGTIAVIGLVAHGQLNNSSSTGSSQTDSIVQITAEAEGLTQLSPDAIPLFASCWWTVYPGNGTPIPMPCPPADLTVPIYEIVENVYLVDLTGGAVPAIPRLPGRQSANTSVQSAVAAQGNVIANLIEQIQEQEYQRQTAQMMGVPLPGDNGDYGGSPNTNGFYSAFTIDTNQLWIELTNVISGTAYANLHVCTNQIYAIWSTTDLLSAWQVELELWPTNAETMPFTVATLNRTNLFLRAEDWTTKDSDSDGVPDWWIWKYYHTQALNAASLDSSGADTLGFDHAQGLDPTLADKNGDRHHDQRFNVHIYSPE